MRKFNLFYSSLIIFALFSFTIYSQTYRVMTYNIRLDVASDGLNNWQYRKQSMIGQINEISPDFIGFQEVVKNQLDYLNNNLEDYNFIGVARDDGKEAGEFSPLFYDSTKYNLIKASTFWLSNTPDKPSKGWDAAFNRICTYGLFKSIENGKKIWVLNTHFDHIGVIARENSSRLIISKIMELNSQNYPLVFMGDLNSKPSDKSIRVIEKVLNNSYNLKSGKLLGTFNGFRNQSRYDSIIDYVFSQNLNIISFKIDHSKMKNGNFISDHFPVIVDLMRK